MSDLSVERTSEYSVEQVNAKAVRYLYEIQNTLLMAKVKDCPS